MNLKALAEAQKDLNQRSSGKIFFYQKNIPVDGEVTIRILPPLLNLNGVYFVEQRAWWINEKTYVSPETFEEDCPIRKTIEEAEAFVSNNLTSRNKQDREDAEALQKLLNNDKMLKFATQFYLPILLIDNEDDFKVIDDAPKVLVVGTKTLTAINKLVTSKQYANGTEDGIADRVEGCHIIVTKTKTGPKAMNIEYSAIGARQATEMDAKYYSKVPDVLNLVKKSAFDNAYLISVINNYLYGEAELKPEGHERFKGLPTNSGGVTKQTPATRSNPAPERGGKPARTNVPVKPDEEAGEDEYDNNELPFEDGEENQNEQATQQVKKPATRRRPAGAATDTVEQKPKRRAGSVRNVSDDLNNLD